MSKLGISELIGILLLVVIGLALVPTIANSAVEASNNGNVSGASSAMVLLLPLIFVVILIVGAVAFIKSNKWW